MIVEENGVKTYLRGSPCKTCGKTHRVCGFCAKGEDCGDYFELKVIFFPTLHGEKRLSCLKCQSQFEKMEEAQRLEWGKRFDELYQACLKKASEL